MYETGIQNAAHVFGSYGCGGWIVGIAQYQQVDGIVQIAAEFVHIDLEIIFLTQRIVYGGAAAKGNLPFIFGVGRSKYHGFFGVTQLNEQRNQLCGAIAYDDILELCIGIGGNGFTKLGVLSVGIGGDGIQMLSQGIFHFTADAQGIYIGGKADNVFLLDMVNRFDLFKIAAVKMVFVF